MKAFLEGKKQPPDDWHSMMSLFLSIALHSLPVDLRHELKIGAMPPRADFLIRKDDPNGDLCLKIFSHFLKMNVVEYKGPVDGLGEEEIWQAVTYLAAQARESLCKKEVKATADEVKGIYHVTGWKEKRPNQDRGHESASGS